MPKTSEASKSEGSLEARHLRRDNLIAVGVLAGLALSATALLVPWAKSYESRRQDRLQALEDEENRKIQNEAKSQRVEGIAENRGQLLELGVPSRVPTVELSESLDEYVQERGGGKVHSDFIMIPVPEDLTKHTEERERLVLFFIDRYEVERPGLSMDVTGVSQDAEFQPEFRIASTHDLGDTEVMLTREDVDGKYEYGLQVLSSNQDAPTGAMLMVTLDRPD